MCDTNSKSNELKHSVEMIKENGKDKNDDVFDKILTKRTETIV